MASCGRICWPICPLRTGASTGRPASTPATGSPISIRAGSFSQRTFGNSATAQSLRIAAPQGTVLFRAEQHFAATLTSISHQMSTDGVHYTAIVPGQQLAVGKGGFWYRASMQRLDANFDQAASPLDRSGEDPAIDPAASVANIVTVDRSE